MRRRTRWSGHADDRLSLTPMIDVTFLLLLFFLCTLRFKAFEGKLPSLLPKDVGLGHETARAIEDVRIELESEGTGSSRVVHFKVVGRKYSSLEALRDRLRRIPRAEDQGVRIRAGAGVVYGDVVGLLDMLILENWTDIGFVQVERSSAR